MDLGFAGKAGGGGDAPGYGSWRALCQAFDWLLAARRARLSTVPNWTRPHRSFVCGSSLPSPFVRHARLACPTPNTKPRNSKSNSESKLNDPGRRCLAVSSKRSRSTDGCIHTPELGPIEGVEELGPKLETNVLVDLEVLENRQVFRRVSEPTNIGQLVCISKSDKYVLRRERVHVEGVLPRAIGIIGSVADAG